MILLLVAIGLGLGAAGYGIHRFLRYAASRGWVYYRDEKRPPGRGLGLLAQIYEPAMEHVIEERASERVRREDDASGEGDPQP